MYCLLHGGHLSRIPEEQTSNEMHINCYERFVHEEQPTVPSVGEMLASFGGWEWFLIQITSYPLVKSQPGIK